MEVQTLDKPAAGKNGGVGGLEPEAITIPLFKVDSVGGNGGHTDFDEPLSPRIRIVGLNVGWGEFIDYIQLVVNTGNDVLTLAKYGGLGGVPSTNPLQNGEYIHRVHVSYGELIDSLKFDVSGPSGERTLAFGNLSGGSHTYTFEIPGGTEICGFHGRYGQYLDSLGIYYRERASL